MVAAIFLCILVGWAAWVVSCPGWALCVLLAEGAAFWSAGACVWVDGAGCAEVSAAKLGAANTSAVLKAAKVAVVRKPKLILRAFMG